MLRSVVLPSTLRHITRVRIHAIIIMTATNNATVPTEQELAWARAIKEAARRDPDLDDDAIVDLEYLHHAIVAKDQVAKAVKRLKRMQKFKQRYGIQRDGSFEEGVRDALAFEIAHPGFGLALGSSSFYNGRGDDDDQQSISFGCLDYSKFIASRMKSEESHAIVMRGLFYSLQLSQSNIAAMRSGMVMLCDCGSMGMRNLSMESEARQGDLFSDAYPIRIRQMAMMNVNVMVRAFYRVAAAVLLSKKVRETLVFPHDRGVFLKRSGYPPRVLPVAWGGLVDANVLRETHAQKLQERYDLAANFEL